jgi:hypothetical protein
LGSGDINTKYMTDQELDFRKLKEVLRRIPNGEFTPAQLGKLMSDYHKKYYPYSSSPVATKPKEEIIEEFNGGLF